MRRPTWRAGAAEADAAPVAPGADAARETPGVREAGYTYVSILAVLAVMAIMAQTAAIPSERARLRDAEDELLFRGDAYRRAVASYWVVERCLPTDLAHLLDDPREPGRRHLRRLYDDPMGEGWTLLRGEDGGIAGVASTGGGTPRRRAFFPPGDEGFAEAETYADWAFRFEP